MPSASLAVTAYLVLLLHVTRVAPNAYLDIRSLYQSRQHYSARAASAVIAMLVVTSKISFVTGESDQATSFRCLRVATSLTTRFYSSAPVLISGFPFFCLFREEAYGLYINSTLFFVVVPQGPSCTQSNHKPNVIHRRSNYLRRPSRTISSLGRHAWLLLTALLYLGKSRHLACPTACLGCSRHRMSRVLLPFATRTVYKDNVR